MKALGTLLKLAQRRLDDLGAEVAREQVRIDGMRAEEAVITARLQGEIAMAVGDVSLMHLLPAFRARMAIATSEIRGRIEEADAGLTLLRERLTVAYQEKSKFSQLLEREEERERKDREMRAQAQLDEAALNLAVRQR